ncbi:dual-action HEIGH metallo-peptidase [Chitinophaga polysaccharea]|uniref:Dual-action HEIGH metallo-peptidase n=1 Tax=Chitinophaga polysaccharea TaxID=1293035 RepID=A0A561PLI8_9BACT|nr:M57 family metalloprotease [Chitinophaga polysaccharea]TWF38983.1 dual-action HEIGH metallo-peptidase [Chitinophaga polysaccharea]
MKHPSGHYTCSVICIASLMLLFTSCSKNDKESKDLTPAPNVQEMTNYLVNQGFSEQQIVFGKDRVVIESDIIITLAELEQRVATWKKEHQPGVPQTEQRRGTYIVSNVYNTNIKFYIDPAVPADWKTAIQGAVDNWNAVNGTRLGMSIVANQASSNTRIFMGFENANWIARAYLPGSAGTPGVSVEINSNFNGLAANKKLFAITHEFGHTIGFHHTNQLSGTLIPGTPNVDPNSVMNSTVLPWNGFTAGDVLATQILYPQ